MHSQNGPQTYQQKVMLLKSRFKNTKDLWLFITDRRKYFSAQAFQKLGISTPLFLLIRLFLIINLVGYLLPSLKATRLQHLQDIMCSKKKVLR